MRKIICCLLVALIAINAMNSQVAFLDKISKTEFGKTILQTLQIQFQTNDGINQVMVLLDRLEAGIKNDAANDKKEHDKKVKDLSAQIKSLKSEIATAKKQIADDEKTLKTKQSQLKRAQKLEKKYLGIVKTKKAILAEATKLREQNHKKFLEATAKLYKAVNALKEGKAIIQDLYIEKKTFVEISESPVFAQVFSQFKDLVHVDSKYQGFFEVFVEMFTQKVGVQADQKLVKKVLDIFDKLIEGLQKDIGLLQAKEKAEVEAYVAQKATLLSDINKNQALADKEGDKIVNLNTDIGNLNENLKLNRGIVKTKEAELVNVEGELKQENKDYADRVKRRGEELGVIAQVRTIFKTEFSMEAKKYVKNVKF